MRLTVLLIPLAMCACAYHPPKVEGCQKPPVLAQEEPIPAPGLFNQCMREIVAYGQGQGPLSKTCSIFLRAPASE